MALADRAGRIDSTLRAEGRPIASVRDHGDRVEAVCLPGATRQQREAAQARAEALAAEIASAPEDLHALAGRSLLADPARLVRALLGDEATLAALRAEVGE